MNAPTLVTPPAHPPAARSLAAPGDARPILRGFAFVVALQLLLAVAVTALLLARGYPPGPSLRHSVLGHTALLAADVHADSWRPLLAADHAMQREPGTSPYAVFFSGDAKFQYPPVTLFLVRLLPAEVAQEAREDWRPSRLQRATAWAGRLALGLNVVLAVLVALGASRRALSAPLPPAASAGLAGLTAAAALLFFPLLIGCELGQFQVLLNVLITAALLAHLGGRPLLAGLACGACSLVKPHYGLVLIWSLLRREHRFTTGLCLVALPATLAALLTFGLAVHLDYLTVLRTLARHSEVFWFNQSLPGLLHRLVDPAAAPVHDQIGSPLPPYVAWIHYTGLAFALAVLGLAFAFAQRRLESPAARQADFCTLVVAITLAAPVAWNHHYGALFPVLLATAPAVLVAGQANRALRSALATAAVGVGTVFFAPEFLSRSAVSAVLLSHAFAGGVLLFAALLIRRARLATGATAQPGAP